MVDLPVIVNLPHIVRFTLVGIVGLLVDLSFFNILLLRDVPLGKAHIMSFFAATIVNYLNLRWSFVKRDGSSFTMGTHQYVPFLIIALLAIFLRGGTLSMLVELWGWKTWEAILAAIVVAALVNYLGSALFVFPQKENGFHGDTWWRIIAIGIVIYTLTLRLVYLGIPALIQEEAYYWNYAQHLDIGYLDHPPMVAWIIWLFTSVLGNTEFAVRIGAFLCWLAAAVFSFRLTCNIFDISGAFRALILIAVLPFFFGIGLVMTPDAPLVACWAGALYFLERALIGERRLAWWGVGVCIGLGMLSKYTIALLGPATLLFLLVDQRSRHWLLKPEPYMAVLVAILLFLPVIAWNANHEWASFIFQGPRRWEGYLVFSLPQLMGQVLLWLTPAGIIAVVLTILSKMTEEDDMKLKEKMRCSRRFALIFSLLPLSVFFLFSLGREVKLNWTGPLWLAMVPFIASYMTPALRHKRLALLFQRSWLATIATSVLLYGAFLHYLVLGIPGIPYPEDFSFLCWKELGQKIEQVEDEIERKTGVEPLVVGMDKYTIASQLAFYRTRAGKPKEQFEKEGILNTTSYHLFGGDSLMYRYWFPEKEHEGRNMILVTEKIGDLKDPHLLSQVGKIGEIQEIVIKRNGMPVGRYYYSLVGAYSERH
jgi:dolichol-phosphate mannosyltransferase